MRNVLLENLCLLNGTSGNESNVREYILKQISGKSDVKMDPLGNIIAFKKGEKTPKNSLMIAAHMDEVAMIITFIREDGTLSVEPVGGIMPAVVIGRQVLIGNRVGVIGSKAVHNLTPEERKSPLDFKNIYVDFGAKDKAMAEDFVSLGDIIYFQSEMTRLGEDKIMGKALDDRAGCAMMVELIQGELEFDTTFVFTVQEEIGARGAIVSTFTVNPDFAIVLETTTAADIYGISGEKRVCELGKGAVVSYMDKVAIYDKELYDLAFETAKKSGIPCQTKTLIAGGNDGAKIHITREGVRTLAISAPCRYLHSPSCMVQGSDLSACKELVKQLIPIICQL